MKKYFFCFYHLVEKIHSFPTMYNTWGCLWGQIDETKHFLQKSGLKTLILAVMVLVRIEKWVFFLAPKIRISARKSIFSYGNLFFRTATWVAQVVTQILRPTDLVYDFSFPSYARFREGTRPMPQKVFPHPTVRAPSASNSPSALSARALRPSAFSSLETF